MKLRNEIAFTILILGSVSSPLYGDLLDEDPLEESSSSQSSSSISSSQPSSATAPQTTSASSNSSQSSSTKMEETVLPPSTKPKKKKTGSVEGKQPIQWESNGLKGFRNQGTIELMEDVVVTQGDMEMKADYAKIFFDENSNEVTRVEAEGNIEIFKIDEVTGEKVRATSNEVVFYNETRKVEMSGNAQLTRGKDFLKSSILTYELDTGWIRTKRVKGSLSPGEEN